MKKIVFLILLLFSFDIKAIYFYKGERVTNTYIKMIGENGYSYDSPYIMRREDGEVVYCIDPFSIIKYSTNYTEYDYNDEYFGLSDDMLDKINIISYFGYGYLNHTDLNWYVITQAAIWKALGTKDVYFTNKANGIRINSFDNKIEELNNLVNSYYLLPSFSNDSFNYTINSDYEIIDNNNSLEHYEIESSNIESKIEGNTLYIKTNEVGNYEINFIRKSPIDRNTKLYKLSGSQSLVYPGKINDIRFKINIEVVSGNIEIKKEDSENIERKFATLEGAIYGIYKDDVLIDKITTDYSGYAYLNNIALGKYYIKELEPSLGYNLDDNIYNIELTYDNRNALIISKENVIKGEVEINKYYGDINDYELEEGAVFSIYDSNDNIISDYETINGKINEKLDYGDYYVVQKIGKEGYSFVDKFNISIKENKIYNFDLYDNILIVEVPDTSVYKPKFNKYSIILILIGLILIFKYKKATHYE